MRLFFGGQFLWIQALFCMKNIKVNKYSNCCTTKIANIINLWWQWIENTVPIIYYASYLLWIVPLVVVGDVEPCLKLISIFYLLLFLGFRQSVDRPWPGTELILFDHQLYNVFLCPVNITIPHVSYNNFKINKFTTMMIMVTSQSHLRHNHQWH